MAQNQFSAESDFYQEKFTGIVPLVIISTLEVILILSFLDNVVLLSLGGLLAFLLILASIFLAIEVESKRLLVVYGIGLYTRVISPSDILNIEIVENKSLLSWLYNPLGTQCLAVKLRNNKTIYLPTRNPKKVISLLKR